MASWASVVANREVIGTWVQRNEQQGNQDGAIFVADTVHAQHRVQVAYVVGYDTEQGAFVLPTLCTCLRLLAR